MSRLHLVELASLTRLRGLLLAALCGLAVPAGVSIDAHAAKFVMKKADPHKKNKSKNRQRLRPNRQRTDQQRKAKAASGKSQLGRTTQLRQPESDFVSFAKLHRVGNEEFATNQVAVVRLHGVNGRFTVKDVHSVNADGTSRLVGTVKAPIYTRASGSADDTLIPFTAELGRALKDIKPGVPAFVEGVTMSSVEIVNDRLKEMHGASAPHLISVDGMRSAGMIWESRSPALRDPERAFLTILPPAHA